MSLKETLTADLKAAMKARDAVAKGTIRMLLSDIKNYEIDKGAMDEAKELSFLATQAKRRNESMVAFEKGDRQELAEQERAELAIIQKYLPAQLSEAEAAEIVAKVIADVGAAGPQDMGKVMGKVMPQLKGRFPGKDTKGLVMSALKGA